MRARVELLLRQNKLTKQDVKDILEVRGFFMCLPLQLASNLALIGCALDFEFVSLSAIYVA